MAAADPEGPQLVIGIDDDDATISGGPADDTIVAGLGTNQKLTGGGGRDVFILSGNDVRDLVADFSASDDTLEFVVSAAHFSATASDGHAVVRYGDDRVDLPGVTPGDLGPSNFILPTGWDKGNGRWAGAGGHGDDPSSRGSPSLEIQ